MKRTVTIVVILASVLSLAAQNNAEYTVKGVKFKMIFVKGGIFTMGCTEELDDVCDDDEYPTHIVSVPDFWMGETEVTQELWAAVMGDAPSYFTGNSLPVEQVSWEDCQLFCQRLNVKLREQLPSGYKISLPTEAQWEYAARGGQYHSSYMFSGSNHILDVAWSEDSRTHVVKSKKPNALGLYDMSGNVWEWCTDWYDEDYYGVASSNNPKGPYTGSSHVIRGGSWNGSDRFCTVGHRGVREPDFTSNYNGFRIVIVK